ncbi:hypothetical protein NliqN6_4484 [Naganishia liquefaciens]|uniref:Uncharacterized protein n=1 Tax=Naganishia liquefaciens TaxID=104408 RepID=A0A8H3TVV5_9TREE|nr:hypothetical protein NliqN6_4484 [Naganishia liquefaciens]
MDANPITPAVSTRKTKNRPGFRNQFNANTSAPVFKWEKRWVAPAGLPEGSTYKVIKWVRTAEKARFPSILVDSNGMDDVEDVDMDGEDREGEGDEQDDEEITKGGDEHAPIDISMDQDTSQIPIPSPTIEETTSSSANQDNSGQPKAEQAVGQSEDTAQPSQDTITAPALEPSSKDAAEDVSMANISQSEQPTSLVATVSDSSENVAAPEIPSEMPSSTASATEDIKVPDVDAGPSAEARASGEPIAPMDVQVVQPLERPEDATDALALPVASAIPLPTPVTMESSAQVSDAARPREVSPASAAEPQAASDIPAEVEESTTAVENVPQADLKRSLTPSPSRERIQEFKEHEAAIEPAPVVAGNLPSPSPQLPSTTEPSVAPSNAVEGAVAGSHVADVQLGGGAAGADAGEVALESVSREPPAPMAEEVTMEGETDAGKSLGEGDPVGVNVQEEFGDEDVRRAEEAPAGEEGATTTTTKDQTDKAE